MNIPEHLHARASELLSLQADGADKARLWAVVLGLKPKIDGNQWYVMWGDNLQEGVCGFGDCPADAVHAFEHAMYRAIGEGK